jgi:hypothetical protein
MTGFFSIAISILEMTFLQGAGLVPPGGKRAAVARHGTLLKIPIYYDRRTAYLIGCWVTLTVSLEDYFNQKPIYGFVFVVPLNSIQRLLIAPSSNAL